MSRRHVNEFRPDEALSLISADREGKPGACPSCGDAVRRDPRRAAGERNRGRVTLTCPSCGRMVSYVDRGMGDPPRDN